MTDPKLKEFPKGFKFGVSTASHQIEGSTRDEGKGENIWDYMSHHRPGSIKNYDHADVACYSYLKYEDDLEMVKEIGADFYRFSISWSRILPTGFATEVNSAGIEYYKNLIDGLIARGIEPVVTMLHFDLPQPLQELGGFQNEILIDCFVAYAKILFENFGDRVKTWLTFNEPWIFSELGHGGFGLAPHVNSPGIGVYICGQNILKAHAMTYDLYSDQFREKQKGRVSIVIHWFGFIPSPETPDDTTLAEKMKQFKFGWFAHPIFSKEGDYPQIMKDTIAKKSAEQGFSKSRLPELGIYWIDLIRGSADFIAINTYSTFAAYPVKDTLGPVSWHNDVGGYMNNDNFDWPESAAHWIKENPIEFGNMFRWMKKEYGDHEILVTENGWPGDSPNPQEECDRIRYVYRYLAELLKAIHVDKIKIIGYSYWSLLDNFEWTEGYSLKFGLYRVDFHDPARPRTLKESGKFYRDVIKERKLPDEPNEKTFAEDVQFAPRINRHPMKNGLPIFKADLSAQ